ncbi:alpha-L-arabinofuranosidase C-terminal domain-containing protein [Teredinibacter turnerae]|uniref:alpha-N-arabinofuranosidase n=1 Tax=Teredinibacter turnerae TaxID=2426 RepID=UPI000370B8A8|nr:alpha-L-arabinofuranosidase C-terminal domain-containing protein [Teredinibacter turnerae]
MKFVSTAAAIAVALATVSVHSATTVTIDTKSPGAVIHRNIYGQFMEHLGRGIYEGIWVGEDSDIPNTKGYRKDVVKALKELQVPLLRWPGGCFADEYHWQDGIGPRDKRKKTVNTTWGGVIDDNRFGTHEFMEFAEMLGAEVYINGNLGTGTPQEMAAWLEYMTSDSDSTLANLRRANGRKEPWKVDYFAVGNESWGCGGTMRPEYYADLYKHYATFLKTPADNQPVMIASGGHTEITDWTRTLLEQVPDVWSVRMQAISHHYYTLPTGDWETHGKALNFPASEWFSTMWQTLRMETFIKDNIAIMDELDPDNKVGFYVDEWGTWFDAEEGDNPGFLYQQNSLRDALVAALNLNLFHKYARRIQMTNIAQMVNVLQAMILTDKEKMVLTPTYHVFKMYIPFQDATSLPVELKDAPVLTQGDKSIPAISASAAIAKDGNTYLALANTDPDKVQEIVLDAGKVRSASGELLTADAMDAHNTFAKPNALVPAPYKVKAKDGRLTIKLPAKSVMVVKLK